jgi:ubiquinone/menaquinone biosynthesis C-methylase UbiE
MSKTVWNNAGVVDSYSNQWQLYEPEKTIRDILVKDLRSIRMLDIGVGAGRTTHNFVGEVKYYAGIDYSSAMLEKCKSKFNNLSNNPVFRLMDATNMNEFRDNSFDFVLFSYNGIDNVDYTDRMKILNEIKRVLAPGGYLAFSTHNLYFVPRLYKIKLSSNPLKHVVKWVMNIFINGWHTKYLSKNYAVVREPSYGFKLTQLYIKPEYQLMQLEKTGFANIRMFSTSGKEITAPVNLTDGFDPWVYYLCRNEK